jgi:hypothetical protein
MRWSAFESLATLPIHTASLSSVPLKMSKLDCCVWKTPSKDRPIPWSRLLTWKFVLEILKEDAALPSRRDRAYRRWHSPALDSDAPQENETQHVHHCDHGRVTLATSENCF